MQDQSQKGLRCFVEVVYRTTVLREGETGKHHEERYIRRCACMHVPLSFHPPLSFLQAFDPLQRPGVLLKQTLPS